ncbi:hypothetical protein [uncultured Ferrovibrio sp.]|jgi:hypothetical protein|uniref:hypothetical protein n=1 Tax=uncultured Ferrovibrio sp. TaxID=1576913 RepID=UPI00261CF249|nr:hypothetical protein [uncultured Ferrovibrio sp.]
MFSLLEITILAMVLAPQSGDFICREREEPGEVFCSNGLTVTVIADDKLRFSNFVDVQRGAEGEYLFSNGIQAIRSAAGGVWFSNGITVRRRSYNTFDFSNQMTCQAILPGAATCRRDLYPK